MIVMSILVVDDDPAARVTCEGALETEFDCYVAGSGEEALMVAEYEQPHLILLDVQMPGMDGLGTLRKLKKNPLTAGIAVILMSENVSTTEKTNQISNAIGIIEKPLDPSTLSQQLRKIFEHL
jgi:two-component system OmpR family response regulator